MHQAAGRLLSAFSHGLFVVIATITPLVVFPWTTDALEINKQTIVIIATIVIAVAWLGAMLLRRVATFRLSWLYVPLGGFLLGVLASGALSIAKYTSLVGQGGQEYTSLLSLITFGVSFILGTHLLVSRRTQRALWSGVIIASAVIGLLGTLPMWPLLGTWFGRFAVNTIGTPNSLGVYLITIAVLGCGLWLASNGHEDDSLPNRTWGIVVRSAIVVTTLTALLALLALDYNVLWVVAMVGVVTLVIFALTRASEFPHPTKFVLPILIFVVSLLFIFIPPIVRSPYAVEVAPSYSSTWSIVTQELQDSSYLFGSGPGTFAAAYTKFRDPAVNTTSFWDTRFDRGASHLMTALGTLGIVPTLFFGVFVVFLGTLAVIRLVAERNHAEWKLIYAPFAAWCMLLAAITLYPQNFTLAFMFWLVSAVVAVHVVGPEREFVFSRSPRAGLLAAFAFVVAAVAMLTTLFVTVSRYRAEISFARAVTIDRQGGSIDDIIMYLDRAATMNRWSDVYYRNLGSALLYKTADVLEDTSADPTLIRSLVAAAVNASVRATELNPANVENWSLRGDIYREVAPIVADADAFAIASYQKAQELEPANPTHYIDTARAYIVRADLLAPLIEGEDEELAAKAETEYENALTQAEVALNEATELKSDSTNALYYLSFVHERKGELAEAVRNMELVRATSPSDVGVSMQLALLYLRQGKNDFAKSELERAVNLVPNYANAHWYLATVLEQEGDLEGALAALNKVLELNPGNETVENRIAQLEEGLKPDPIPEPLEPDNGEGVLPDQSTP